MKKSARSPMLLMALTVLIDFTGFGLILPLLPFWAEHLGANPVGVGLILTVYALAQFIFTPLLGSLSDRYGRKPVIFASLLIEVASLAFTALASTLPLLLLARFVGGIGASNIGSAQAVVSDTTTPAERAKGMGLIGAAIGLGFVIGPALGGLLMPLGSTVPFWVAACAALLNALLVLILLPETRPRRANAVLVPGGTGALNMFISGWRNAARYPAVLRLVLINLLFIIAFSAMEGIFPLFAQHIFGWGAMQTGYIFTYVGIIVVIMQGGLVGRLVKRWGEHSLLIAGLALLVAGLILMAFSAQLSWLLITLAMLSIGDGAVTPTVSTLLSFTSPAEAQGETLGLSQGVGGLGRTIGPLAAGAAYTIGPGMPFIAGGILGAIALLIALPAFPIAHKEEQAPLEKETASAERQS